MTSGDRLVALTDNIDVVSSVNVVSVLGDAITSIDDLKAAPTDLTTVNSKLDAIKSDTDSMPQDVYDATLGKIV